MKNGLRRSPAGLRGGRRKSHDIVDRFWARVNRGGPDDCWLFQGAPQRPGGHLVMAVSDGRRMGAHKFSFLLHGGEIPDGYVVCHSCDVPACVNPAHLRADTQAANVHESARKGRKRAWGVQKLDAETVYAIRAAVSAGALQKDIAEVYGISRNHVSSIVNRKVWAHLPLLHNIGEGLLQSGASLPQGFQGSRHTELRACEFGGASVGVRVPHREPQRHLAR